MLSCLPLRRIWASSDAPAQAAEAFAKEKDAGDTLLPAASAPALRHCTQAPDAIPCALQHRPDEALPQLAAAGAARARAALPSEIWLDILSHLSPEDHVSVALSCRRLYVLTDSPELPLPAQRLKRILAAHRGELLLSALSETEMLRVVRWQRNPIFLPFDLTEQELQGLAVMAQQARHRPISLYTDAAVWRDRIIPDTLDIDVQLQTWIFARQDSELHRSIAAAQRVLQAKSSGRSSLLLKSYGLTTLLPLGHMPSLRALNLNNNPLTCFAGMQHLFGLEKLSLLNVPIASTGQLPNLPNLADLAVSGPAAMTVDLAAFPNMRRLQLNHIGHLHMRQLDQAKQLVYLDLSFTTTEPLRGLSQLTQLRQLILVRWSPRGAVPR